MKRILSILLCSTLCFSLLSNFTLEVKAAEVEVQENIYDTQVIPDMHNTGARGVLTPWREYFGFDESQDSCYLSANIQNTYGTVYENVDFSDVVVTLNKTGIQSCTFRNCFFGAESSYNVNIGTGWTDENVSVTFENCTFTNGTSASIGNAKGATVSFDKCLFYGVGGDAQKAYTDSTFTNCYFHSIGSTSGAHADGLQASGDVSNLVIRNCRFNGVSYGEYITNACIFLTETTASGVKNNITIEDVYLTGGNYSLYFNHDNTVENPTFTFNNINIGNAAQYGMFNAEESSDVVKASLNDEVKAIDSLHVSSVYTEDEKTSIIVSNYTGESRELLVITEDGSYITSIVACPNYTNGMTYSSLAEFPFDLSVDIEGSPEYIICYDVTDEANPKQLRFVSNTSNPVMVDIDASLLAANEIQNSGSLLANPNNTTTIPGSGANGSESNDSTDGNIEFTANIDSWFEVKIPNSYNLTNLSNELEFTAEGDIAGSKTLSITTDESIVLKNTNEDELVATLNMAKTSFTFAELKDIANSSIVIEVENLPAGRFVGEMPIYISIIDAEESIPDGVITGQINETVNYRLENGIFTISGTGGMSDYYYTYENYRDQIVTVVIEDGVDCVGLSSFQDCPNLETIYLGSDVQLIKGYAFKRSTNLKSVYMPTSVVEVYNGAFASNNTNTTIYYAGTEEQFNQITGVENMEHLTILYEQTW